MPRTFSYRLEREYYQQPCSASASSYSRLELYLYSLVAHPEAIFVGKRVLEIGAGPAFYSRMIAERFAPKQVVALDLVPAQLTAYQVENRTVGVLGVGADCFRLPFWDKSFDVILGSLILHRFQELEEVLREIHRVLVNKGLYLGIEPSLTNPMHLFRHLFTDHSPNEYLLSTGRIRKAFTRSGFHVNVQRLAPRLPFLARVGFATCVGLWAKAQDTLDKQE